MTATLNIHHVKLKSRKEMERTIPRERWGWWVDVSAGQRLVLRDATAADLARCNLRKGDTRGPADFLCELPADGSLVSLEAIEHRHTVAVPVTAAPAPSASPAGTFQDRVQPWMLECFGAEIAADQQERNHRFLEEALELVQACGATASEAHQLVDYVYGRPVGEKHQEVGGVMVTLAALCLAQGLDMHAAGETELARIWAKVEQIRAKQAAKPKHSPLPEHVPAAPADQVGDARNLLIAASHALRSYQYGNAAPDLAESIADRIDAAMSAASKDRADE